MHGKPRRRRDFAVQPQRGDAEDFAERGVESGVLVLSQAAFEFAQDRVFGVPADADDERNAEFGLVSVVQRTETGELRLAQAWLRRAMAGEDARTARVAS